MGWFTGFVVFLVIWWVVLFIVLPIGVRTPDEAGVVPLRGHAASAPVQPRIGLKMAITTAVSLVLWAVYYFVAESGLVSFRP